MPVTKATSSSSALQQRAVLSVKRDHRLKQFFSDHWRASLPERIHLWRIYVMWSKCCFRGISTPAKKKKKKSISWGKHWTEMFIDLSLAVLQNYVQVRSWPLQTKRTHGIPLVHHTFLYARLQILDIFSICAVVVSPHVPCLTAKPEDTSQPQAALTSTWYCQRWLYFLLWIIPPVYQPYHYFFKPLHQFCRQTLLSFVNIFSFIFLPLALVQFLLQ